MSAYFEQYLTINLSPRVRIEKRNGREFFVAHATLIVPGVLNGSRGPLLYPPEEVSKDPSSWNGIPIVVYHPTRNGQHISGRDPDVQKIGHLYKTEFKGGKLIAEAWFDAADTQRVDHRVHTALKMGMPIGLSTGLFTANEPAPAGSRWLDGRPYSFIAKGYKPDHLAILPDQKGACSLNDGCGVLVNGAYTADMTANCFVCNEAAVEVEEGFWEEFSQLIEVLNKGKKHASDKLDMTPEKACQILKDGTVHGHTLTEKQRGMFGALCGKRAKVHNKDGSFEELAMPALEPEFQIGDKSDEEHGHVLNSFNLCINCGGEGGTPGPCPRSGGASGGMPSKSFSAAKKTTGVSHRANLATERAAELSAKTKEDAGSYQVKTSFGTTRTYEHGPSGIGIPHDSAKRILENLRKATKDGAMVLMPEGHDMMATSHDAMARLHRQNATREHSDNPGKHQDAADAHEDAAKAHREAAAFKRNKVAKKPTTNADDDGVDPTVNINALGDLPVLTGDHDMPLTAEQKSQIVNDLVTNCGCQHTETPWKGMSADVLNKKGDDELVMMDRCRKMMAANNKPPVDPPTVTNGASTLTPEQWLKLMPVAYQPVWNGAVAVYNEQKNSLIAQMTANIEEPSKTQAIQFYMNKDLEELRMIYSTMPKPQPTVNINFPQPSWFGSQGSLPNGAIGTISATPGVGQAGIPFMDARGNTMSVPAGPTMPPTAVPTTNALPVNNGALLAPVDHQKLFEQQHQESLAARGARRK